MEAYDVAVIGAGPGGYVCAIKASQMGLKTVIVDKEWLGGVCLNVGCIPSKALLRNAEIAQLLRERAAEFGVTYENLKLDYSVAVNRSRQVSERLTRGVAYLMKKNQIDVIMGTARLSSKDQVSIETLDGDHQEIKVKNIVLACGAYTLVPQGWQVDGERILTYLEAIKQTKLPASVVIIGAGAIGVEFATIWNSYGVQVTLVEMMPNLLPLEDEEVSVELLKIFKKQGIQVFTGHKVDSIQKTESDVSVLLTGENETKTINAEQALVAIGFMPNTRDLNLEEVGIQMDSKGFVQIDERMATNVPGIWAVGDVTGKLLLAHVASTQGIVCAENMAGKGERVLNYQNMPRATFCRPQVASFGLTEAQARAEGYELKIGKFPFQPNGKALGLGETTGFVKIISEARYGEILGVHMIGPEVSELLPELTLAQQMELTAEQITHNVHIHPTLSEVLVEAAEAVEGQAIHI